MNAEKGMVLHSKAGMLTIKIVVTNQRRYRIHTHSSPKSTAFIHIADNE